MSMYWWVKDKICSGHTYHGLILSNPEHRGRDTGHSTEASWKPCGQGQSSHQRPHAEWSHLYKMCSIGKSWGQAGLVVACDWGEARTGCHCEWLQHLSGLWWWCDNSEQTKMIEVQFKEMRFMVCELYLRKDVTVSAEAPYLPGRHSHVTAGTLRLCRNIGCAGAL